MEVNSLLAFGGAFVLAFIAFSLLDEWIKEHKAKKAKVNAMIEEVFKTYKHRKKDRDDEK